MNIKPYIPFGIVLPAITALVLGVTGAPAETKPKQPAAAAEAKPKQPAAAAEAKAKQPAAAAEAKAKQPAAAAETKPKQPAAAAEAKAKQPAAAAEAKPKKPATAAETKAKKPAAAAEAKAKQPAAAAEAKPKQPAAAAEARYVLAEKSNLRESANRESYSPVWLAKGVKVESQAVNGSFKRGYWRHVIVSEGQEHAGRHGWVRRDWLEYKGQGK